MKKRDKLHAHWSEKENDLICWHPLGQQTQCDASYFFSEILDKDKCMELKRRGYDLSTLKFEISPSKGNTRFWSQQKFYFESDRSAWAVPLKELLEEAKRDGKKEITVYEADPYDLPKWKFYCEIYCEIEEASECNNRSCPKFTGNKRFCGHGLKHIYKPGKKVTFKIE
jgi:hypothetical protein